MGVNITAYRTATPVADHFYPINDEGLPLYGDGFWDEPEHDDGNHIVAFAYTGFEQSLRGLEPGRCYKVGDRIGMLSRSYTGYGHVREQLARGVMGVPAAKVWEDPDSYRHEPMFEIVNFADNEGCIGPEACADLAVDFADNRERFLAYLNAEVDDARERDSLLECYDGLTNGFIVAAGTGLVELT